MSTNALNLNTISCPGGVPIGGSVRQEEPGRADELSWNVPLHSTVPTVGVACFLCVAGLAPLV